MQKIMQQRKYLFSFCSSAYTYDDVFKDGVRVWLSFCSTKHANLAPFG